MHALKGVEIAARFGGARAGLAPIVRQPSRRLLQRQPRIERRAGKILSPYISGQGYPTIAIKEGARRPKYSVHRLVASAFCEGYAPGLSVNHIDGDKTNNRPSNLEWVTLERNTAAAWETGQCTPEAHATKLTADQASAIKARLRDGARPSEIAPAFGVSQSLVYLIKQGKRWAAVT